MEDIGRSSSSPSLADESSTSDSSENQDGDRSFPTPRGGITADRAHLPAASSLAAGKCTNRSHSPLPATRDRAADTTAEQTTVQCTAVDTPPHLPHHSTARLGSAGAAFQPQPGHRRGNTAPDLPPEPGPAPLAQQHPLPASTRQVLAPHLRAVPPGSTSTPGEPQAAASTQAVLPAVELPVQPASAAAVNTQFLQFMQQLLQQQQQQQQQ